jgi:hypothetical protein
VKKRTLGFVAAAALLLPLLSWAQQPALLSAAASHDRNLPEFVWKQSLPIRYADPAINPIGGTEVRALAAFDHHLFAAIGYWMDTAATNLALPGAQVLRLDSSEAEWKVDLELEDRNLPGLRLYQAISNLQTVRFATDDAGHQMANPVDVLIAGVWKRGTGLDVFVRRPGAGPDRWTRMIIPGEEEAPRGTQTRSFFHHRDRVSGVDMIFAGASNFIFSGAFNQAKDKIVWNSNFEWQGEHTGKPVAAGRVSSFAEANGKLYATARGVIYERADGPNPSWKSVFETTIYGDKVTGLRGLTAIPNPSGKGQVLVASIEDHPARIYFVDPNILDGSGQFSSRLELDVSAFLTETLGTRVGYAGIAYNDTTAYPDPSGGCTRLLIGLEAVAPNGPRTFGARHHISNAYYLVRDCDGRYALREIRDDAIDPQPDLVAVRALIVSPFPSDPAGTVYAGGFDTNRDPVHNTAWLYKGVPKAR